MLDVPLSATELEDVPIILVVDAKGKVVTHLQIEFDLEADACRGRNSAGTAEVQAGRRFVTVDDIDVGFFVVVVPEQRLVHLPRKRQRDLPVRMANCRCFKFCDALFKISAAVAAEISGLCRAQRHTTDKQTSRSKCEPARCTFQSPVITLLSVGLRYQSPIGPLGTELTSQIASRTSQTLR